MVNFDNLAAMMLAFSNGHINIVKFLKKQGTDVDIVGVTINGDRLTSEAYAKTKDTAASKAILDALEKICAVCRSGAPRAGNHMMKCGSCLKVWYCGEEHQHAHWPEHKAACAAAKAQRNLEEKEEAEAEAKAKAKKEEGKKKKVKGKEKEKEVVEVAEEEEESEGAEEEPGGLEEPGATEKKRE